MRAMKVLFFFIVLLLVILIVVSSLGGSVNTDTFVGSSKPKKAGGAMAPPVYNSRWNTGNINSENSQYGMKPYNKIADPIPQPVFPSPTDKLLPLIPGAKSERFAESSSPAPKEQQQQQPTHATKEQQQQQQPTHAPKEQQQQPTHATKEQQHAPTEDHAVQFMGLDEGDGYALF